MIRAAILADTHANETSRWSEHCSVMDWCAADFDAREVDLVGHAGDIFDGPSTPTEREYIMDWCQRVAKRRPLTITPGNHEKDKDVRWLSRLRSDFPIFADDRPTTRLIAGVAVASLPWPRKGHLLASLGAAVSPEASSLAASDALRAIIQGLGVDLDQYGAAPRLLLAHAMVDGAKTNHDQPLMGADMAVSAFDLTLARAHFVALGHVHNENQWLLDVPVAYANTIRHTDFGTAGPTGYLLIDFDELGGVLHWERVSTPARPMLLVDGEFMSGQMFVVQGAIDARGAEVRLCYATEHDQQDAAERAAKILRDRWIDAGAHSVRLVPRVIAHTRARAPEITSARTLADKLEAYWKAKGTTPDPARRERLLGRLAMLESSSTT